MMRIKRLIICVRNSAGFTLVEVLIAMLILSIVVVAGTSAFVFSAKTSSDNEIDLMAMNLAEDRIEAIRAMSFANVGTYKEEMGGTRIPGSPAGNIPQSEKVQVNKRGIYYTVNTTIGWVEQSGWDMSGGAAWDYKSVKVEVIPKINGEDSASHTKVLETVLSRDATQPAISNGNISLRMVRGWVEGEDAPKVVVPKVEVNIYSESGGSSTAFQSMQTDSAGIVRFLDIAAGDYRVEMEPSTYAGMMLEPGTPASWIANVVVPSTVAQEFKVEYPCKLKLALRDLDGSPIVLEGGEIGALTMNVPYGDDISKSFTAEDQDEDGILLSGYLGELWPLGAGYAGKYALAVSIPDGTYFGAYDEQSPGVGELWDGVFTAPGTTKQLTCYFGVTPKTPAGLVNYADEASGEIMTQEDGMPFDLTGKNVKFATTDPKKSLVMPKDTVVIYQADRLFFENKGSDTDTPVPGLLIRRKSELTLNAGVIVFRGRIVFEDPSEYEQNGTIVLSAAFADPDTPDPRFIAGSDIGGDAVEDQYYGKLYLEEPIEFNGETCIEAGGYYFYDGLTLPGESDKLIPITKDNYVKN